MLLLLGEGVSALGDSFNLCTFPKMKNVEAKRKRKKNKNCTHPLCWWLLISNCTQFISPLIEAHPTAHHIILLSRLGQKKTAKPLPLCDSLPQVKRLESVTNRFVA